ncbi:MAG: hypothetical protein RPT95_10430 [Candidatus Sedimenticola sp. (ex Thyasira tokunagai)]
MTPEQADAVLQQAIAMAQELQEICDDAEEDGSPLGATQALVDEWEELYKQIVVPWQSQMKRYADKHDDEPSNLDAL